jgi:ribA/ribD-fused uncharacterized protein
MVTSFTGEYRFLSNFWRAEIRPFWWPDSLPAFPGNEWLYQAWKIDGQERSHTPWFWLMRVERIRTADTPSEAKRLGRMVDLREDWGEILIDVMRYCVQLKFKTHADLRQKLLDTGDAELVEGNHWGDRFWGAEWDKDFGWTGLNWLGTLLMEEREELRKWTS